MSMMNSDVDEIKQRINIVDFIQSYVPLKKSGSTWKGLCPFHQEKTPSFTVNEDRQIFKCFGCSEAGDALDFLQKMEHLTFPEALQMLADRVGVILDKQKTPAEYAKEKDEKSRLYKVNRLAAQVYHKLLLEHPRAASVRDYLHKRGLTDETVRTFQLGYAPTQRVGSSVLGNFLAQRGFQRAELQRAGSPERFSERVIFPLWDVLGNPVGFTGRSLLDEQQPKYLNTPETPLFHKGRILYPLHLAKDAIKKTGRVILVEGQLDVLLAHQLGTAEVVASSGTALTSEHLKILARYTSRIFFAFDQDGAGQEATRKALILAYQLELEPMVISLPADYKDLGDLAIAEPAQWEVCITQAQPGFQWQLEQALDGSDASLSSSEKKAAAQVLLPLLLAMRDPIERAHWTQYMAKRLRVSERSIAEAVERYQQKQPARERREEPAVTGQAASSSPPALEPGDYLLGLAVIFPEIFTDYVTSLDDFRPEPNTPRAELVKVFKNCYNQLDSVQTKNLFHSLRAQCTPSVAKWFDHLVAQTEAVYGAASTESIRTEIESILQRLKMAQREQLKGSTAERIRLAEERGDRVAVRELLKELQQMLKD